MNTRKFMIIAKNEIKTKEIISCHYNKEAKKWDVQYTSGKTFQYAYQNIKWLKEPTILNPRNYRISREQHDFFDIDAIFVFHDTNQNYWHICFGDGSERDYLESELQIQESCLPNEQESNTFEYLKQISRLSQLRSPEGDKLLSKQYERVNFIGNDTVLANYLNPSAKSFIHSAEEKVPIFPFGCNKSQYKAVKTAMENQMSVIQGPPGTGKTQTILNIIANILIDGKTVLVVSNNNSAIDNIFEKLSSQKYDMGFIVAPLGKAENKKDFLMGQTGVYPNFIDWRIKESVVDFIEQIKDSSIKMSKIFVLQEELAQLKQENAQIELEMKYFKQYLDETSVDPYRMQSKYRISSNNIMRLWQEYQAKVEQEKKIGIFFKLKGTFLYRIASWKFFSQDISRVITSFQEMYYTTKHQEIVQRVDEIQKQLSGLRGRSLEEMCNQSLLYLKDYIARNYMTTAERRIFTADDLWKNSNEFLKEYPVVLSTTFSARSSLGKNVIYDYLIMDEASLIDVATGALALSCAKNVVIVGDTKQLPNVVTEVDIKQVDVIFNTFKIDQGYQYTKSFLQSALDIFPNIPQTLLREHYRCHPKIVNFCNQKFYNGDLVIMTQDHGEKDVLSVMKTVEGNHERNHYNQRQIDVIKKEILLKLGEYGEDIGVIAPYRNQVEAMKKELPEIDIATVHKFQGREKNAIVISTVDDELTDFSDDPFLINVAVSRAKKKLIMVTSGNEQAQDRNISDLVSYIEYQNFEVQQSQLYSVFDYLYKQYTNGRQAFLQGKRRISNFDSENLMYALITDVLHHDKFCCLEVVCHQPLNMLIRNPELLNDRECIYAMNPATHVDFLIFNRVSKKPVLVVEVDGYQYHQQGSKQSERDKLKDHILELYGIPFQRFSTNGSGEKERLFDQLDKMVG